MTTTLHPPVRLLEPEQGNQLSWAVADIVTMAKRNILAVMRTPEALFFTTLQPIMFVLLFTYVFGGAIHVPGGHYIDYLMPGIFVQTVIFGAMASSSGLAEDLHKGIIERFRALPMSRSAVLAGRTVSDLVRNVFVVALITLVGYAVGFRIGTNFALFLVRGPGDPVLRLRAELGLRLHRPVGAQRGDGPGHGLPAHLPAALRLVGLRPGRHHAGLAPGIRRPPTRDPGRRTPSRSLMVGGVLHDSGAVWSALLWTVGLLVVLAPVAVRKYRKVA